MLINLILTPYKDTDFAINLRIDILHEHQIRI